MSRYLNPNAAIERLRNEWDKHKALIIAVDVDSTLLPYHTSEYKDDYEPIRQLVRDLYSMNCIIIIFTAANPDRWPNIKAELELIKIPYHYFNQSPPDIPDVVQRGKVYANAYLDDRAGLHEVYNALLQVSTERKMEYWRNAAKNS